MMKMTNGTNGTNGAEGTMTRLNAERIITLNCGVGRDSVAMICLLVEGLLQTVIDGVLETLTVDDIDAVIFSDTGAEWSHTYSAVPEVRDLCEKNGLRFIVLEKPTDSQTAGWIAAKVSDSKAKQDWVEDISCDGYSGNCIERKANEGGYHLRPKMMDDYMRVGTIATRSGACTCNHKINAVRRFLDDLSRQRFGIGNAAYGNQVRKGLRRPHISLVGFAADEKNRLEGHNDPAYHGSAFPLIDMGIRKEDETPILERHGLNHVRKSGCVCCPRQPSSWFWALSILFPETWETVRKYEAVALEKNPKMFIKSTRTIDVEMERWRANNPDAETSAVLEKSYISKGDNRKKVQAKKEETKTETKTERKVLSTTKRPSRFDILFPLLQSGSTVEEMVESCLVADVEAGIEGRAHPKATVFGFMSHLRKGDTRFGTWTINTEKNDQGEKVFSLASN